MLSLERLPDTCHWANKILKIGQQIGASIAFRAHPQLNQKCLDSFSLNHLQ